MVDTEIETYRRGSSFEYNTIRPITKDRIHDLGDEQKCMVVVETADTCAQWPCCSCVTENCGHVYVSALPEYELQSDTDVTLAMMHNDGTCWGIAKQIAVRWTYKLSTGGRRHDTSFEEKSRCRRCCDASFSLCSWFFGMVFVVAVVLFLILFSHFVIAAFIYIFDGCTSATHSNGSMDEINNKTTFVNHTLYNASDECILARLLSGCPNVASVFSKHVSFYTIFLPMVVAFSFIAFVGIVSVFTKMLGGIQHRATASTSQAKTH